MIIILENGIFRFLLIFLLLILPGIVHANTREIVELSHLHAYDVPSTKLISTDIGLVLSWAQECKKLSIKACRGEYEPASIVVHSNMRYSDVCCRWSALISESSIIPAGSLDVRIVKAWYQAGSISPLKTVKTFTHELLLKDDSLVIVDTVRKMNWLRMHSEKGIRYQDISTPSVVFPLKDTIYDSDTIMPFSLGPNGFKQLWITLHVPVFTKSGDYYGIFHLVNNSHDTLLSLPMKIEVLPFDLTPARLTYSLYYHGVLVDAPTPLTCSEKSAKQLRQELLDMQKHGVTNPTCYQSLMRLEEHLKIRNELGFSQDKLYYLGITTGASLDSAVLEAKRMGIQNLKNIVNSMGYRNLFIYGVDEARGKILAKQRKAWKAVHLAGAKIFAAGAVELIDSMSGLLDVGIVAYALHPKYARRFHAAGAKIFSYANPQVGVENPETYRRNYGFALFKSGYDGAMDYAYQKNYKAIWNDFDEAVSSRTGKKKPYRDETFVYPTSNGLIPTIQWEGFREAVDDVRYLSTLLDRIEVLKAKGHDMSRYESWVNALDPTEDLDALRAAVVEQIQILSSVK
ncbi:MAG: hypothetical protein A2268_13240 [Candidatus Raymondbacteria bacterium RifOxyA12_full_50_37]|uniref:Uncharacterized protein n=1 Tax=Candidatus Raymondbacteria bacterium RIFOXYD12_FULL_49_13 TaxID=1817890 RepID=A0A1F7EZW0_UNCRA|nr:MAG: hypothetical protein A2268_13240 [Candidatus Raymondbacteria bacterium RifOxyA12_full_50_37]OGJ93026.1 MAG: hypothetical protein A2248_18375 [Candidatus Raymondbacteria bacterium RIFOXYA2_FULL_49_16]OGJ94859.1 MAG: hypothetical protein A2350_15430 [Candidatus Raymondbacteria bacterium RifOxyB12_full_50_8]OGJ99939.1 MAG: hypothetical protein A2519_00355 [Candidatus Raymondbacteria bacterium RIFOXYD12_FULL_49_13]OGK04130.1 MAG: hypothetical protein A2487_14035 [Candidatus Raymondbacteria 